MLEKVEVIGANRWHSGTVSNNESLIDNDNMKVSSLKAVTIKPSKHNDFNP